MRTAAYNSVFLPTYAINATNVMMVHPTAAAVGGTSDMKAPVSLCPRESQYSPSIISVMTLPGRGADLWVGWMNNIEVGAPTFT